MAYFRKIKSKTAKKGYTWGFTMDVGIDPVTGKRKQTSRRGFATKSEAEAAYHKLKDQIYKGLKFESNDVLFKDVVEDWYEIYKTTVKISTLRARKSEIEHLLRYFGNMKLKNIKRPMYQQMLNDFHGKGYARGTISGIHTAANMIFKRALELELIHQSPTTFAKLPKKQETVEELEKKEEKIHFLEKQELMEFLKKAKCDGLYLDYQLFATLSYTGMRLGEALALKWSDINFEESTLSITKTLYNPNNTLNKYQLLTPKTHGSIRTIFIDEFIHAILKKHRVQQSEYKLMAGNDYVNQDFIFANPNGYPLTSKLVRTRMQRLLKKTSIKKHLTPHSLRHTHTSLLIEAGVGVKEIQEVLGHSDIQTTMNIYAHMTKDLKEKTSHKFGQLMKGLSENL
ncbi:site-specific integrase [Priestia endophytica]|uniref:site-specific integrase n=1 Tax=Priestia endophytica TaxID=135735 RepID=UPI00203A94D6|nr:site-specific integrase [Priestia endophytica]MCM3538458.1 site-specific integrase [Priestia endophytica]